MTLSVGSRVNEGERLTVTVSRNRTGGAATALVEINDGGVHIVAVEFSKDASRASTSRYTVPYDGKRDTNRELTVRIGAGQDSIGVPENERRQYSLDTRTRTVRVNDRDAGLTVADDSVREGPARPWTSWCACPAAAPGR